MTPAPTTTIFLGTFGSVRAPVEETTVFSSISMPGSDAGSEPVAMMMFFASCTSSPTLTLPASGMEPQPLSQSILFFLNRNSMPPVLLSTTDCLYSCITFQSTEGALPFRPMVAKLCSASCSWWVACSRAFEGMQPTLRQVPPRVSRPSTQAVLRPSWAQRMAAT